MGETDRKVQWKVAHISNNRTSQDNRMIIMFYFYPFSTVACKVLFIFFPQGSLRSSHQISPQEFLGELKSGVMDERLFACLDSLRVSLTSNPVRYNTDNGNSLKQSSVYTACLPFM